jgi:hypothetical protein
MQPRYYIGLDVHKRKRIDTAALNDRTREMRYA